MQANLPNNLPNNLPKMTLRRFVRVTFDNFRQLIQTIAVPVTSLPMPQIVPPPAAGALLNSPQQPSGETRPAAAGIPLGHLSTALAGDVGHHHFNEEKPPSDDQPSDDQPSDDQPSHDQPSHDQPSHDQPSHDQPSHDQLDHVQADTLRAHDNTLADQTAATPVDDGAAADEAAQDGDQETATENTPAPVASGLSLAAALESLLFVSDQAVEPAQLARALNMTPAEAEAALQELDAAYRRECRGLRVQMRNGRYQLVTAPEAATLIESFLNLDTSARLSAPALEALAVVAYRQPVTRAQIEAVRGVDCSGLLRSLLQRGLLEEVGRLDAPGRPVLYGVTDLFMHHFGLTALHDLPPIDDADLARIAEAGA